MKSFSNPGDIVTQENIDGAVFSINGNNYVSEQRVKNLSRLGFVSKAQKEIELMPQTKGTGDQILGYLRKKDVKEQELYWTGVQSYLEDNKEVT